MSNLTVSRPERNEWSRGKGLGKGQADMERLLPAFIEKIKRSEEHQKKKKKKAARKDSCEAREL